MCDLETGGRGHSVFLKMAQFDRSYKTYYWSAVVIVALFCTIFEFPMVSYSSSVAAMAVSSAVYEIFSVKE